MGYRTTVIDPRGVFGTEVRFPHADRLIHAWPDEALAQTVSIWVVRLPRKSRWQSWPRSSPSATGDPLLYSANELLTLT
jgi:hypothetical protein